MRTTMRHEVVINDCYGGFGISDLALSWLKKNASEETKKKIRKHEPLERHNPDLIKCVKTLGSEAASGSCSRLKIVKIEGNKYRVQEYDGAEWIETPAAIEWTEIKEENN